METPKQYVVVKDLKDKSLFPIAIDIGNRWIQGYKRYVVLLGNSEFLGMSLRAEELRTLISCSVREGQDD